MTNPDAIAEMNRRLASPIHECDFLDMICSRCDMPIYDHSIDHNNCD
jgi:hypothetical protein